MTPSHFVLDSRGRYDRLAVPGLLYFKPPWCSKNIMLPGSCCQVRNCVGASFIYWSYVIALQGYFDSFASFFTPLRGGGGDSNPSLFGVVSDFLGESQRRIGLGTRADLRSCSEWYHNNLQLNNHGGKNSKSTYSNGWILFHF